VFLCKGKDEKVFKEKVEEIIATFHNPIKIENVKHIIKFNIGIVIYPIHSVDYFTLVKYGNIAMNFNGGNSEYNIFSKELLNVYSSKVEISTLLESFNIENLEVFFQPIVSTLTSKIVGFEALTRVKINNIYLNTQDVIDYYESKSKITDIDLIVFKKTCENLKHFKEKNKNIYISCNFSTLSITKPVLEKLKSIIVDYNVSTKDIVIEITETNKIEDYENKIEVIKEFKNFGFRIALDDFGTGNCSLHYLNRIPLDILKIDRHFLMTTNKNKTDILLKVIKELSELMGFTIVAEGIEELTQLDYIKTIGFELYQGFYFSRPTDLDSAIKLFEIK
jgi:EAL domain-containing protein (putative c-di-GMP-specific phosphodiesterase class I)